MNGADRGRVEVGLREETGADHRPKRGDLQGVGQPAGYARVAEELVVTPDSLHGWSHADRTDCDHELDRTRPTAGERGDVGHFRLGLQSEARWATSRRVANSTTAATASSASSS